jgi:hypothetical protein
MARPWRFKEHVKWAGDPHLRAQNAPDSPTRTTATTIGGGGLVWGAWFALTGRDERVTPASIAFLADTFLNLPSLLPRSERGGLVSGETCVAAFLPPPVSVFRIPYN